MQQNNTRYTQIITSKSGKEIPVFASGKTVDSRYDPEREGLRILQTVKSNTKFFIVTGIASGVLLNILLNERPDSYIIAVENNQSDIDFLMQIALVKELSKNDRLSFCTIDELLQKLTFLYVPSFYGNLEVIEQAGWINENPEIYSNFKQKLQTALSIISADFSVQSHFGKLWFHNIISNLQNICKTKNNELSEFPKNLLAKTAVILGAGPTLEHELLVIKQNRNDYFIIATDTAFSILNVNEIIPDAVVSLDGQNISGTHFINTKTNDYSKTLFLFDLTSNPGAVRKVKKMNGKVLFFKSGHPLSEYLSNKLGLTLPLLFSGAGTVTISAIDFALKAGFTNLIVLGADFAYVNGKSYAKGTYLDRLYNHKNSRINPSEKQFDNLLFRTPLIKKDESRFTTNVLDSYRVSLEEYLTKNNVSFIQKDNSYILNAKLRTEGVKFEGQIDEEKLLHCFRMFLDANESMNIKRFNELSEQDICLLPLISWLRFNDNKNEADFIDYLQKAVHYFKKYL